jgi:hypothetical protein
MKVISDQDLRVATLTGAVVLFKAGVEREVSDEIGLVAIQSGAKQVGDSAPTAEVVVEEAVTVTVEEPAVEPSADLIDAMNALIEQANPDDFKADGSPKAAAVNRVAGRTVQQDEREQAWEQALNS